MFMAWRVLQGTHGSLVPLLKSFKYVLRKSLENKENKKFILSTLFIFTLLTGIA